MGKQKFFIIVGIIGFFIILSLFLLFSGGGKKEVVKGPAEFNIWVVGDETAGYSNIITNFKAKYTQYAKTDIKFTKFSSYKDYEKILLNVMLDGNSPDIFVVNNTSTSANSDGILDSKTVGIPKEIIDTDYFSKNFNRVFDELVIQNEEITDGKKYKVSYLKGVPMGYETLGVFYNFRKVNNVPSTWSELDKEMQDNSSQDYATIGIGTGLKYMLNPVDVLSLLFIQSGIDSYTKLDSSQAISAFNAYRSYANDDLNGIKSIQGEMDELGLQTIDMFVRGKIGMVIGFPSLIKEIVLAKKRVGVDINLSDKFLRTAPIFQIDSKGDKLNFVNYNYFAISAYSNNKQMGFDFLSYLSEKSVQEEYMKSFPYYLPAMRALEDSKSQENLELGYDRTKFEDFIQSDVTLKGFTKGLKNEFDNYLGINLDLDFSKQEKMLSKLQEFIKCNVNHLINKIEFEKQCE